MRKVAIIFFLVLIMLVAPARGFASTSEQLIIINKSTNELAFFDNHKLVKTFSVATGRSDSLTPEGHFKIVNKIVNRPYYKEGIPGGSPNNPLGNRWLGLDARGTYGTTYAIHGNNNSASIGKYVSAGCVRMHNDEVQWLFNQVRVSTPVVIGHFKNDFVSVAETLNYTVHADVFVAFNNELFEFDQLPRKIDGRIMVPMRQFFEKINVNVDWVASTKTIMAKDIKLQLGSSIAKVNGQEVILDVPPTLINDRVFIPLRFVSEALNIKVNWDEETSTAHVFIGDLQTAPGLSTVKVAIDNGTVLLVNSYLKDNVLMVPVRDLFQNLEATVNWEEKTKLITVQKSNNVIQLSEGSNELYVNGEKRLMQIAIENQGGEVYLPLRHVTESLGMTVVWNGEKKLVVIYENPLD